MKNELRCIFCILIIFLLCSIASSYSQEVNQSIKLSLEDCVSLALKSNLDISIQRINPQIQDAILATAKSRFDPSITFGPSISRTEEPPSAPGLTKEDARTSDTESISLGISDPIITGGHYGISFNSNRSGSNLSSQTFNPAYRSGLGLTFTQPLLEGFGLELNRSAIVIARNNQDISLLSLKARLIRTLSDVQRAYWDLVFAIENLKVQEFAIEQANNLLKLNLKLMELGKASKSDILQAQVAVASREADVIAAKDAIQDAEERLKLITNIIQDESQWNISITPTDQPVIENIDIDLGEGIAAALEKRTEYVQSLLDIKNSDIKIKQSKNKTLPILDLEGTFDLNGLGGDFGEPLSQVGKFDYKRWYLGLALRIPLGEKSSKAELKINQLEKEQKLLALKNLEQQIIGEVRGAIRQTETDAKRIEATDAAQKLAKEALLTEEEKYKVGLSSSYQLLQFQAGLAAATVNYLRTVIDYRKSVISLDQALGVTLEKLNIEIGE